MPIYLDPTRPVCILRAVKTIDKGTAADVAAEVYGSHAALGSWVSSKLHSLARQGFLMKEQRKGGPWMFELSFEGEHHLNELEEKAKR